MSQQLEMIADITNVTTSRYRELFIETAASLGARVCRDALWAGDRCNWIGPLMEPLGGRWRQVHKVFGPEFSGGTSKASRSHWQLFIR